MTLNPPAQYADDRNLRARQRFWLQQSPPFDHTGWVMDLAGLLPGMRVLDAGCGYGLYLRELRDRQVRAVGCDLSLGMLRASDHPARLNADITALPLRDGAVEVALAIHMLYHVPDREAALRELRRVVAPGGVCIAVTCVRPANPPVIIREAAAAADYVASLADHYQDETERGWDEVTADVRGQVQAVIDAEGAFITSGDLAAFICS